MASTADTIHTLDVVLLDMETAYHNVIKHKDSRVKLPAKELNLLVCLEKIRDTLWYSVKEADRETLQAIFGGDCKRIARIRAVLDSVEFSPMNAQDARRQGCLNACESTENVLKELGSFDALKAAEEEARRRLIDDLKPDEDAGGAGGYGAAGYGAADSAKKEDGPPTGSVTQIICPGKGDLGASDDGKVNIANAANAPQKWGIMKSDYTSRDGSKGVGYVIRALSPAGELVDPDACLGASKDGSKVEIIPKGGIGDTRWNFLRDPSGGYYIYVLGGDGGKIFLSPTDDPCSPGVRLVPAEDAQIWSLPDWVQAEPPAWARPGVKVVKLGRKGVLIKIDGPPVSWKVQWEDGGGDDEPITDWSEVTEAPPDWAAAGVKVVRIGRKGQIIRNPGGFGVPWGIAYEDGTIDHNPKWEDVELDDTKPEASGGGGSGALRRSDSASADDAPPVGAVVEDDWAELMGIVMCKIGCGRRSAPGVTRSGKPFDTCCRDCAMGEGHTALCGKIDPTKLGHGLCKLGCGRAVSSGVDSMGMKRDTCCRGCAKGEGHDDKCGKDAPPTKEARSSVISLNEHAFFAEVKGKMSTVSFNRFMEQCRLLNRGTQSLDTTLDKCRPFFGDDMAPLFFMFERLLRDRVAKMESDKKKLGRGGGGYR